MGLYVPLLGLTRLRWSPHLPYPVRLFIREQITADPKRQKSMRLSADTKAKPSTL